jgi:hypothetical protein
MLCRKQGAVIAEVAAAMAVLVPVVMAILLVTCEASYAYLLKGALSEGAREAARNLAIAYGLDPTIAGNRQVEDQKAFDKIRVLNIINSSAQFADPVWDTASDPPTVSVYVKYASDQYGLPHFPNPDPLNIGNSITISGQSTFRLQ